MPIHPAHCRCARCLPDVQPSPSLAASIVAVAGFLAVVIIAAAIEALRGYLL